MLFFLGRLHVYLFFYSILTPKGYVKSQVLIGHAKDYFMLTFFTLYIRDSSVCIESEGFNQTISYY